LAQQPGHSSGPALCRCRRGHVVAGRGAHRCSRLRRASVSRPGRRGAESGAAGASAAPESYNLQHSRALQAASRAYRYSSRSILLGQWLSCGARFAFLWAPASKSRALTQCTRVPPSSAAARELLCRCARSCAAAAASRRRRRGCPHRRARRRGAGGGRGGAWCGNMRLRVLRCIRRARNCGAAIETPCTWRFHGDSTEI
jgi:hypothetical protein